MKKMRRSSEGAEESGRRDHQDSLGISIAPAIVCDSGFVSSAPSERCAYSFEYPGFRFAPPWAKFSYAFGVQPLTKLTRMGFSLG